MSKKCRDKRAAVLTGKAVKQGFSPVPCNTSEKMEPFVKTHLWMTWGKNSLTWINWSGNLDGFS